MFSNFKRDLLGGITTGIVALPPALAFGVSSGLGESAGLYGAIFISFLTSFFGGTPTQISGPVAPMTAVCMIVVGIKVIDYKGLKAIPSLPRDLTIGPLKLSSEVIIMLVVLALSTLWNLVYAVGIGLVIASLMFMKKIGDLTAKRSEIRSVGKENAWADERGFPDSLREKVFIKHIMGALFFGSTSDFLALADQIPETASTVIIRLGRMQYMDQSGLYAMEDVLQNLRKKRNTSPLRPGPGPAPIYDGTHLYHSGSDSPRTYF